MHSKGDTLDRKSLDENVATVSGWLFEVAQILTGDFSVLIMPAGLHEALLTYYSMTPDRSFQSEIYLATVV